MTQADLEELADDLQAGAPYLARATAVQLARQWYAIGNQLEAEAGDVTADEFPALMAAVGLIDTARNRRGVIDGPQTLARFARTIEMIGCEAEKRRSARLGALHRNVEITFEGIQPIFDACESACTLAREAEGVAAWDQVADTLGLSTDAAQTAGTVERAARTQPQEG